MASTIAAILTVYPLRRLKGSSIPSGCEALAGIHYRRYYSGPGQAVNFGGIMNPGSGFIVRSEWWEIHFPISRNAARGIPLPGPQDRSLFQDHTPGRIKPHDVHSILKVIKGETVIPRFQEPIDDISVKPA